MKQLSTIVLLFCTWFIFAINAQIHFMGQSGKEPVIGELTQGRGFALADGYYCYEGVWNGDRYRAQPCMIEFTKRGNRITGTYTNEYWNFSTPLIGQLKGSTLTLTGTANHKTLIIKLSFARGLWRLTGHGTHGTTKATIPLERIY